MSEDRALIEGLGTIKARSLSEARKKVYADLVPRVDKKDIIIKELK